MTDQERRDLGQTKADLLQAQAKAREALRIHRRLLPVLIETERVIARAIQAQHPHRRGSR